MMSMTWYWKFGSRPPENMTSWESVDEEADEGGAGMWDMRGGMGRRAGRLG